jgi:hypothetical protein
MKITKKRATELFGGLQDVSNLPGVKFAYNVIKNTKLLQPEIDALQKAGELSEEFKAFEIERMALAQKFAKKDKEGNPVIENNSFVLADQAGFDKEFKLLQKKHDKAIKARESQVAEFNKLLEEEIEVDFFTVKLSDVPQSITPGQVKGIFEIIVDEK